jgi:hypothetical protein
LQSNLGVCSQHAARAQRVAFAIIRAVPAEMAAEVFRGHAVEPLHPAFQVAVIVLVEEAPDEIPFLIDILILWDGCRF